MDKIKNLLKTFNSFNRSLSLSEIPFNGYCFNCDELLTGRRKRFCSAECNWYCFCVFDWPTMRKEVWNREEGICQHCKSFVPFFEYEIDHIKEISTGKDQLEKAELFYDLSNCQLLCVDCHKQKTSRFLSKRFTKITKKQAKNKSMLLEQYW